MRNRFSPRYAALTAVLTLTACANLDRSLSKPDLSTLAIGMSRQDVVARLGKPHQVSQQGQTEYLIYNFDHPWDGRMAIVASYFVRLIDGQVESFGERGDFDSTKDPAVSINVKESQGEPRCDLYTELRKLEALKKDGVLSETEFQDQKQKLLERCQ